MPRHRIVVCLLLAVTLAATGAFPPQAPAAARQSAQTANDCAALVVFGTDYRPTLGEIACGTLTVPENWDLPASRPIEISYVVLRATGPNPAPDPVVYLEGGPGGSALRRAPAYDHAFARLREQRDVILFDQRGAGRSSPLECAVFSSFDDLFGAFRGGGETPPAAPASADDPDAILAAARVRVLPDTVECARELFAGGIDLTQYNSRTIARDTVALVAALGYDRYNLYGISYGGRVALTIMRDHPRSGLRSVVLDSPYPPNLPGYEQSPGLPHEVAMQFFADCALDPACGAAYPDLKDRFVALLARLATDPILAPDGTTIEAADVVELLRSIGNQTRAVPYLPLMIAELEGGKTDTYQGIVSGELFAQRQPPPDESASDAETSSATPPAEAAQPVDDAAAFPADEAAPSPARRWLREVEVRAQTLPGDYSAAALQLLIMLDKLPRTRATLEEFVARAFEGEERAADREALLAAVTAMTEEEVRDVFAVVAEAPDLVDTDSSGINGTMFNSVECHEAIRFESFRDAAATVRALDVPALAAPLELVAAQFARCEVWPSGTAPDVEFEAVVSDVPTLLMAGAYDVQTPVSWSKLVFLSLPNAYYAFFPMAGHGTVFYSDCAQAVGAQFVDRPDRLPDLACTADLEPTFVLPAAAPASETSPGA